MPGRRWRILAAGLGVLAASVVASPATAQPSGEPLALSVGVYENEPKVFTDNDGRPAGIFIDVLNAVAQAEGWKVTHVPCGWSECLRLLEQDEIDLLPDVAFSAERAERYDFNRSAVLESWSQLYAHPDVDLTYLADLNGKRVALLDDSIQQTYFEQMVRGFGVQVEVVPTASLDEAFGLVAAGKADAVVSNHFFGEHEHRAYGLERTPLVFQIAQLHFAAAKGRGGPMLAAIDKHLQRWRSEAGSPYYVSLSRWTMREPGRVVPPYFLWVIGIAFGLLGVASALVLVLRRQVRARTRHLADANQQLTAAQQALLESEALLKATQRLSKVGGWQWDVEQQSMTWTEETYRIYDVSSGSTPLTLDTFLAAYGPAESSVVREAFQRCLDEDEPYDLEAPFTSVTGRRLWVRTSAQAVREPDGKAARVVGSVVDITAQKRAETERQQFEEQRRISQRMEAIGQLAGGVAHDFNNLITVINAYAGFALRACSESHPARAEIMRIQEAAARATALTAKLLAFGRQQTLQPSLVDLNRLVTDLETMLRPLVGEDIELILSVAAECPTVLADRGQLEQVVVNLVTNARDAMPEGGTLTIKVAVVDRGSECQRRFVLLSVADTGTGMDAETRDRVFEPFFTTKEKGRGTGLGLAIIYGIVEQSGGTVEVQSELGKGTTVTVTLPWQETGPAVAAKPAHVEEAKGNETVLVVEDDEVVRGATERLLRSAGYTVITAASGPDALKLCEARKPDLHLLLTDVAMPAMTGPELAQRLLESYPRVGVLFMSGHIDKSVLPRIGPGSELRLISKPFTEEILTRTVREVLDLTQR